MLGILNPEVRVFNKTSLFLYHCANFLCFSLGRLNNGHFPFGEIGQNSSASLPTPTFHKIKQDAPLGILFSLAES